MIDQEIRYAVEAGIREWQQGGGRDLSRDLVTDITAEVANMVRMITRRERAEWTAEKAEVLRKRADAAEGASYARDEAQERAKAAEARVKELEERNQDRYQLRERAEKAELRAVQLGSLHAAALRACEALSEDRTRLIECVCCHARETCVASRAPMQAASWLLALPAMPSRSVDETLAWAATRKP